MSSPSKVYNSDEVSVVFGSVSMSEKGLDEFCTVEQLEKDYTTTEGVGGDVVFNRTNSKLCRVTVRLLQTSRVNKLLSEIRAADLASGNGVFEALTVRDRLGNDLHTSSEAKIEGPPSSSYSKEAGELEWSFLAPMDLHHGGH